MVVIIVVAHGECRRDVFPSREMFLSCSGFLGWVCTIATQRGVVIYLSVLLCNI